VNKGRAVHLQTATTDTDQPRAPRGVSHGANRAPVMMTLNAYEPLKALAEQTHRPMTALLEKAVTLLLLDESAPVPPKLRARVRVNDFERD
jgi:hypothetical protein